MRKYSTNAWNSIPCCYCCVWVITSYFPRVQLKFADNNAIMSLLSNLYHVVFWHLDKVNGETAVHCHISNPQKSVREHIVSSFKYHTETLLSRVYHNCAARSAQTLPW